MVIINSAGSQVALLILWFPTCIWLRKKLRAAGIGNSAQIVIFSIVVFFLFTARLKVLLGKSWTIC